MIQKVDIIAHIKQILEEKIDALTLQIKNTQDSQANDTKSSAGDKFETGREMLQAELNKYEGQRANLQTSLKTLLSISPKKVYTQVAFGALIKTNAELYFIAIGLGKIEIDKTTVYAISLASPIGQALHHKQTGDRIIFQGRKLIIDQIL